MKKVKLLLPVLSLSALAGAMLPLASCNHKLRDGYTPLCFSDIKDGKASTVGLNIKDVDDDVDLDLNISYSTNGKDWQLWYKSNEDTEAENITIKDGRKLYVKNETNQWSANLNNFIKFTTNSEGDGLDISGNVSSLLNKSDQLNEYCFVGLFMDCQKIVNAKDFVLQYKTLKCYCYAIMFYNCSSLSSTPDLPATTLVEHCYDSMFASCSRLKLPPQLPAKSLGEGCYEFMFSGCTSLESAPDLPATTLANTCYKNMFLECTSLALPPDLPATTLNPGCYSHMFSGCTSLELAPNLPATTIAESCYTAMFYNCVSLNSAPQTLPAMTLAESCYISMFSGCTNLITAPKLPSSNLVKYCYNRMFYSCSSLKIKEGGGEDSNKIFDCPSSLPEEAVDYMFLIAIQADLQALQHQETLITE